MDRPEYIDERLRGERECFYCLDGHVFIGSITNDGEEVFDAIRCRKCGGTGVIADE